MKKIIVAVVAIVIVVVGFASLAQAVTVNGERQVGVSKYMVRPVKVYTAPSDNCASSEAKILRQIKSAAAAIRTDAKKFATEAKEAKAAHTKAVNNFAEATKEYTKTQQEFVNTQKTTVIDVKNNGRKLDALSKNLYHINDAIQDQNVANTGILAALIGIVVGLLVYFIFFRKDGKDDILNELKVVGENLSDKIETARTTIPVETAKTVNEYFDSTPFTYDIEGKHVECNFSVPEDECYLTLKIESTNGSQNPGDFERQALDKHKRGFAAKYVRGTMTKFLKGGLAGTDEEKLIKHLQSTGAIKIS